MFLKKNTAVNKTKGHMENWELGETRPLLTPVIVSVVHSSTK
jgi:hypothetical protein